MSACSAPHVLLGRELRKHLISGQTAAPDWLMIPEMQMCWGLSQSSEVHRLAKYEAASPLSELEARMRINRVQSEAPPTLRARARARGRARDISFNYNLSSPKSICRQSE